MMRVAHNPEPGNVYRYESGDERGLAQVVYSTAGGFYCRTINGNVIFVDSNGLIESNHEDLKQWVRQENARWVR